MTASQAMEILSNLETGDKLNYISNSIFIFLCGVLVFSMQAGFALLETGMTRSKNTSNIWMKNLMDFCVGVFAYFLVGYGLQYGDDFHGLFGTTGFLNPFNSEMQIWADCVDMQLNPYIYFFFQMAFCGATATIISGAVAERFKFGSYLICSLFMTGLVYPVGSHWIWGGGWLSQLGFVDFAGTLAVHGIGGMAALVCAAFVGPRIGKYDANGESHSIRGHNISLFGLGAIFLWFGWYGFNPGSELGFDDAAAYAAITSTIAGGIGGLAGLLCSWIVEKKPNVDAAFNGTLAGLVAICSTADSQSPWGSALIAIVAAVVVYFAANFVDKKLHIDDACGAGSLHFVSGIFGVLAPGFLGATAGIKQFGIQLLGEVTVFVWVVGFMCALCAILKKTVGIRVSDEEQKLGLDISEHATTAYDYLGTEKKLKDRLKKGEEDLQDHLTRAKTKSSAT